jgi:hypothetical protein
MSMIAMAGLSGCGHALPNAGLGLGVAGGTALLAQAPGNEIEQVYYLGVFDPREQIPPTVYRLTVRGQASGISNTRFGSGWVQASLIDSLNTTVGFDSATNRPQIITGKPDEKLSTLTTGRRLMLFGPEGFREAPKDHRLVLVMGASPEAFFKAIDESLAVITQAQRENSDSTVSILLFQAVSQIRADQKRLDELAKDVAADLPQNQGGK